MALQRTLRGFSVPRLAEALGSLSRGFSAEAAIPSTATSSDAAASGSSAPSPAGPSSSNAADGKTRGTWVKRPQGPVRIVGVPRNALYSDITEFLAAAGVKDVESKHIHLEYGFQGGVPRVMAAWYNPGGGSDGHERRRAATRVTGAILSFQQVSAKSFPLEDFEERTRANKRLLRRCLFLDNLPEKLNRDDLFSIFADFELECDRPILVTTRAKLGLEAPGRDDDKVAVIRFRNLEEALRAYRDRYRNLRGMLGARGGKTKICIFY